MKKKALILFVVFLLPIIAYLYLITGHNHYHYLEIYGPKTPVSKTVNGATVIDTVYHNVGGFSLINSDSVSVTEAITKGKIQVVSFFMTSCKDRCAKATAQMMRMQHETEGDDKVVLLSISIDPVHDTPSVLKKYASDHTAKKGKWFFLTGDKDQIVRLARESYYLPAADDRTDSASIIHSEQFVLVDSKNHIRGYYDGADLFDVKRLVGELKLLEIEEKASGH